MYKKQFLGYLFRKKIVKRYCLYKKLLCIMQKALILLEVMNRGHCYTIFETQVNPEISYEIEYQYNDEECVCT